MRIKIADDDIAKSVLRIQERDGVCSPRALVEEARDPSHPLHGEFEWDDTTAAEGYRIHQARKLIGRVKIVLNGERTPAHVHVTYGEGDDRKEGYVPVEMALSDDDLRAQVFSEARIGLAGWRKRLAAFEGAAGAVHALDDAISKLTD